MVKLLQYDIGASTAEVEGGVDQVLGVGGQQRKDHRGVCKVLK